MFQRQYVSFVFTMKANRVTQSFSGIKNPINFLHRGIDFE